jgi:serine/threonine protein kinase
LDPDAKCRTGQLLDKKYRVVRLLGEGGMGAVYEAEHTLIRRRCAVKFLHAEIARNDEIVKRFVREAQAASSIGHPGIIDIYDVGVTPDGAPYLVMELLEGRSLATLLDSQKSLPVPQAVEIVVQALGALAVAHSRGIVHRDLKPDNLFIRQVPGAPPSTKILDFGISHVDTGGAPDSKLTRTGSVLGTPMYMAPEQAGGLKEVDQRLDLYAMGVILYECLTGRVPFLADNYNRLLVMILGEPFPAPRALNPSIPAELEAVIIKAMARRREDRYGSADEMLRALLPFLSEKGRARLDLPEPEVGHAGTAPPAGGPMDSSQGATIQDDRRSPPPASIRPAVVPVPTPADPASTTSATPQLSNALPATGIDAPSRKSKALPIAIATAVVAVVALAATLIIIKSGSGDSSAPSSPSPSGADSDSDVRMDSDPDSSPDAETGSDPQPSPAGTWRDPMSGLVWQKEPDEAPRILSDAAAYCAALALGGFDDWRVPTITELRSLIRGSPNTMAGGMCPVEEGYAGPTSSFCDPNRQPTAPAPGDCYWPPELLGSCEEDYWSTSVFMDDENLRWAIVLMSTVGSPALARCVHGDQLAPPAACGVGQHRERGECVSDPPWTDPTTGLTWENLPHGQSETWSAAAAYCNGLVLGGYDDWQLPTLDELRSLVRGCPKAMPGGSCAMPAGRAGEPAEPCQCELMAGSGRNGCYWPAELQGNCASFWSASPFADDAPDAWFLNFGCAATEHGHQADTYYVRCVRHGSVAESSDTDAGPVAGDLRPCDGGLYDAASNLCWQEPPSDQSYPWSRAKAYCAELSRAGHGAGSWHLPTINEVRSFIRGCPGTVTGGPCGVTDSCITTSCENRACKSCSAAAGPGVDGSYWDPAATGTSSFYCSSSRDGYSAGAWSVGFDNGFVQDLGDAHECHVRCVRDGP